MSDSSPSNPDAPQRVVHHVSRRGRQSRIVGGGAMQLNLTPMIDVIFLLLIYFVITANFAINEGVLTAKLPQGSGSAVHSAQPPDQPIHIVLNTAEVAGCAIALNTGGGRTRIDSFPQLTQRLITLQYDPKRGRRGDFKPDNPVLIEPVQGVRWQHVVNAFNAAIRARYANVRFAPPR